MPSSQQRFRYDRVRVADQRSDQKTPAQIVTGASGGAVTQEEYQEFVLSQIKRIVYGADAGNWYSDFASEGVQSLKELSTSPNVDGAALLGTKDGFNTVFTTPDKFINVVGGSAIKVYYNGVRLSLADDYSVFESVPGTGYDTVQVVFAPFASDKLTADYVKF